jgi:hypothetical protein
LDTPPVRIIDQEQLNRRKQKPAMTFCSDRHKMSNAGLTRGHRRFARSIVRTVKSSTMTTPECPYIWLISKCSGGWA